MICNFSVDTFKDTMIFFCRDTSDPTDGNCEKLLENYADKSATYMYCAILNARPFTFCESCVDGYLDVYLANQEIYTVNLQFYFILCSPIINYTNFEIIFFT
jgi:hypothetical protein